MDAKRCRLYVRRARRFSGGTRLLLLLLLLLRGSLEQLLHARRGGGLFQTLLAVVVQRGTDADVDEELLARVALVHTADGRGVAVVAPVRHADVPRSHRLAHRRIET